MTPFSGYGGLPARPFSPGILYCLHIKVNSRQTATQDGKILTAQAFGHELFVLGGYRDEARNGRAPLGGQFDRNLAIALRGSSSRYQPLTDQPGYHARNGRRLHERQSRQVNLSLLATLKEHSKYAPHRNRHVMGKLIGEFRVHRCGCPVHEMWYMLVLAILQLGAGLIVLADFHFRRTLSPP